MTYSRNALTCRACGACLTDCSPLRHGLMAAGGRHVEPGSPGCQACGHTSSTIPTPEEDAVLAAYNVALVAQTMGLGSCFVSMAQKAIRSSRAVRKAIGIPAANRVLAVLVVGYPVRRRVRPVVRRALPMTRAA